MLHHCKGPNEERARHYEEQAEWASMMAGFYRMEAKAQRIFVAAFEQAVKESKAQEGKGNDL